MEHALYAIRPPARHVQRRRVVHAEVPTAQGAVELLGFDRDATHELRLILERVTVAVDLYDNAVVSVRDVLGNLNKEWRIE